MNETIRRAKGWMRRYKGINLVPLPPQVSKYSWFGNHIHAENFVESGRIELFGYCLLFNFVMDVTAEVTSYYIYGRIVCLALVFVELTLFMLYFVWVISYVLFHFNISRAGQTGPAMVGFVGPAILIAAFQFYCWTMIVAHIATPAWIAYSMGFTCTGISILYLYWLYQTCWCRYQDQEVSLEEMGMIRWFLRCILLTCCWAFLGRFIKLSEKERAVLNLRCQIFDPLFYRSVFFYVGVVSGLYAGSYSTGWYISAKLYFLQKYGFMKRGPVDMTKDDFNATNTFLLCKEPREVPLLFYPVVREIYIWYNTGVFYDNFFDVPKTVDVLRVLTREEFDARCAEIYAEGRTPTIDDFIITIPFVVKEWC